MAELFPFKVGAKVASLPILIVPKISDFGHIFWDMNFKICFALSIDIKGQTKLEVNWSQIDHFSLQNQKKNPEFF